MTMYLRAATPTANGGLGVITGRVLHLAVWAPDAPGTTLVHGGTWVALCSRPYARPIHYRITGPGARGWERHSHWPTCTHCVRRASALLTAAAEQFGRIMAHRASLDRRCPARWEVGPHCGLVADHDGAHVAAHLGGLYRWGPPHLTPPAATTRERETR